MASGPTAEHVALLPAESMVLAVARAQAARGESITPNIGAMLVLTIDRLMGTSDWTLDE